MTTRLLHLVMVAACLAFGVVDAVAETATAVSAGASYTCAVTAGGGVQCWGQNHLGQLGDGTTTSRPTPAAVIGLPGPVQAVAAGQSFACALTTGGGVVCWGRNDFGQLGDGTTTNRLTPVGVSGLSSGVLAVAVRNYHACAVTNTGVAKCWGRNNSGQLGDGTTADRRTPTTVTGLSSGVAAIAAGASHTCAVMTGGAALCWGYNGSGQLGDGTTTNRTTPTPVSGLPGGASSIVAGVSQTCAVTPGGGAACWGYNYFGQLGDGTATDRWTPTPVSGLSDGVGTIAAGDNHFCAVTAGGGVLCWGYNYLGQLGDGTTSDRPTPTPASALSGGVSSITAGQLHTCAVTSGGDVACWGSNGSGELGDGTTAIRPTPTPVTSLASGVASIAASSITVCAVTTGGAATCWGANRYGQLGDGTTTIRLVPTPVSGLGSGVEAIATGPQHTCAVTTGGAVLCWGRNSYGQLGDGTTTDRWTPTPVSGLSGGVKAIAAGGSHTCALTTDGAVTCWGYNAYGQLGNGTAASPQTTPTAVSGLESGGAAAIATGDGHSCAVTTGGAAKCWGDNSMGQLGDWTYQNRLTPTQVYGLENGVAAISTGTQYSCALTTGGAAKCWGTNWTGQLGDGTTTDHPRPMAVSGLSSDVAGLTTGGAHTCAVTTGGSALCWGYNDYGQLGDGTTTSRSLPTAVVGLASGAKAIAAGGDTCAITTAGGVMCWGNSNLNGARVPGMTPLAVYGFGGAIAAGVVAPNHGSEEGGTVVTIAGAYFLQGATVTIGGVAATVVSVVSTSEIVAVTAPHVSGAVNVVVTNPDATQSTIAGGFTYEEAISPPPQGDFTGDLKSDILWHHATRGEVWLWPMDGATATAETYVSTVGEAGWEIRGLGDQTGDGQADLLWRHAPTGMLYLWTMNGSAVEAETYVGTVEPAYDIVGTGDYNGDGRSDILWRHAANGELWVWLMDGVTTLSVTYVDTVDPAYEVQGSGDLNADGQADIVWRHATQGDVWAWLMHGAVPAQVAYVATVGELEYRIVGVADHTGDGKADLLWHHATRGEVWLWPMDGVTVMSETYVATVADTGYRIVGTGDYDGDGKADLLWHHATQGDVWVWLMNGPVKLSENFVGTVPETEYQIVKTR